MSCPDCSTILRGADTVNLPALLRDAQAAHGPLMFCDGCKRGDRSADRPPGSLGLTHAETLRTLRDRFADFPDDQAALAATVAAANQVAAQAEAQRHKDILWEIALAGLSVALVAFVYFYFVTLPPGGPRRRS